MAISRMRSALTWAACAALVLTPALAVTNSAPTAGGRNLTQEQQQKGAIPLPSLAPLTQHVLPAVVNLSVQLNQQAALQGQSGDEDQSDSDGNSGLLPQPGTAPFDQFLRRFFQNPFSTPSPGQRIMTLGSGFIIDPHGYIVTNNHVVANAEKVTVIFPAQSQHPAKFVGRGQRTDLALLKVKADQPMRYVT